MRITHLAPTITPTDPLNSCLIDRRGNSQNSAAPQRVQGPARWQKRHARSAPLILAAETFDLPIASLIVRLGAVTAMLGVALNLVLGLSRVELAMGRRADLPRFFARLNDSGSPNVYDLAAGAAIGALASFCADFTQSPRRVGRAKRNEKTRRIQSFGSFEMLGDGSSSPGRFLTACSTGFIGVALAADIDLAGFRCLRNAAGMSGDRVGEFLRGAPSRRRRRRRDARPLSAL
jgi:amino acid transporter